MTVGATSAARVGVDLVSVPAFRERFEHRDDVLAGTFRDAELAYCLGQIRPWPHLAARFAAKEAVLKALGTGLHGAMEWRDVEVTRDVAGAPSLRFHGAVAEAIAKQRVSGVSVSLSHTADHAVAMVVLSGGDAGGAGRA